MQEAKIPQSSQNSWDRRQPRRFLLDFRGHGTTLIGLAPGKSVMKPQEAAPLRISGTWNTQKYIRGEQKRNQGPPSLFASRHSEGLPGADGPVVTMILWQSTAKPAPRTHLPGYRLPRSL